MSCKFCYIPFDGADAGIDRWKQIIVRCAELGMTQISFGGGDPFLYDAFLDLVHWVRGEIGQVEFVHVDTNGLALTAAQYSRIAQDVDLIGFPVDGPSPRTHAAVRGSSRSFGMALRHLQALSPVVATKVNTVVTKQNIDSLPALAERLRAVRPRIWALYEFWPIGDIASEHASRFTVSRSAFDAAASEIVGKYSFCRIEAGSVDSRSGSYFFVTQTGRAYAVTASDPSRYVELGSVFDPAIASRWAHLVDVEANSERMAARLAVVHRRSHEFRLARHS